MSAGVGLGGGIGLGTFANSEGFCIIASVGIKTGVSLTGTKMEIIEVANIAD